MPAVLAPIIAFAIGSAIARLFFSLGIGLFTYFGLYELVSLGLNEVQFFLDSLPVAVVSLLNIAGVGEAISIIGSALLTRATYLAMRVSIGLTT